MTLTSPMTPFGLKAAKAMTNLKHMAAAPQEQLPHQSAFKKQKTASESAIKMKEAAAALTGLARMIEGDQENMAPGSTKQQQHFAMGTSSSSSSSKPPRQGFASWMSRSLKNNKIAAVAPLLNHHANSNRPPPQSPMAAQQQQHNHHLSAADRARVSQVVMPPRRPNPLGWMWPSLPVRPPHMFGGGGGCFPGMQQQNHPPPRQSSSSKSSTTTAAAATAPIRHQRRPVVPPKSNNNSSSNNNNVWTEDDEQRLKHLEAEYRFEQAKAKKHAWNLAANTNSSNNNSYPLPPSLMRASSLDEEDATVSTATDFNDVPASRKKRTTWTDEEDERLRSIVSALEYDGNRKANWTDVARLMPGRDSKQCRDRWLNHLDPALAKHANSPWTAEEDEKLVNFIKNHGTRWRLMQLTILPNRSELTIKNRWNSSMKRRYTRYLADKWGVPPANIQLLNSQGLLHPGVSVEQMLDIAKCNMAHVNRNFGEPLSCKDELVVYDEDAAADKSTVKTIVSQLNASSHSGMEDTTTPTFVRVIKTKMSDESVRDELGVIEVPPDHCFATTRTHLFQRFGLDNNKWKFTLPEFGIITAKQEIDLGCMNPILKHLKMGRGTRVEPAELVIVEQA